MALHRFQGIHGSPAVSKNAGLYGIAVTDRTGVAAITFYFDSLIVDCANIMFCPIKHIFGIRDFIKY
jgi:hypothetical protein